MDKIIKTIRIILIFFFIIWLIIWFSIRAYNLKIIENKNVDIFSNAAIELYQTTNQVKKYFKKLPQAVKIEKSESLMKIGELSKFQNINDSIYILHSKSIDNSNVRVLLQNIKTGEIALSWNISLKLIISDLDSVRQELRKESLAMRIPEKTDHLIPKNTNTILIRHPIFLKDSSLIFKAQDLGIIYKIDKNSKMLWKSERLAHHSIEIDENGEIWTCSIDLNNETANKLLYRDDALLQIDSNGKEKYFNSLTAIFQKNNLFETLIESTPSVNNQIGPDPYHINDIQPVKNGTHWNKGDVFFSLRHKSLVILFRPKTEEILWMQQGLWYKQHDINIENDSIISIFNNNVSFLNNKINTSSNIAHYNFNNDSTTFYANNIFKSKTEGRQTILSDGNIIIESTNEAIYFILDPAGDLITKFYVPFYSEPKYAQYPGWSRFYIKEGETFIEQ